MKILFLAGGGDIGGAKTHILHLASELSLENSLCLVSFRRGSFLKSAQELGLNARPIHTGIIFTDLHRLIRVFDEIRPDIVHSHGAKANMMAALLKCFRPCTYLTTLHSDYKKDYLHSKIKHLSFGTINAVALRFLDDYVAVSNALSEQMARRGYSPHHIYQMINGLDFDRAAPVVDKTAYFHSLGLTSYKEGDIVAGFAARLTTVKDIPTLLRGFAGACKKAPRLKLVIAGDGEDREALEKQSHDLGISGSVTFAGWLSDMASFFEAVDLCVLSSLSEGFPYSIVEGARARCAIISTHVGGIPTLIENGVTGLLFAPGDAAALSAHLVCLAENAALRQTLGDAVYTAAKTRFSLSRMRAMQQDIYQTVLRRKKRPRRDGVVICGAYGRGNAGDDAIQHAIIGDMRALDQDMPITLMTRRPAEARLIDRCAAFYTFNPIAFLRALSKAKLLINGGGSLIQDATSSRSLYFYLFTLWAARLFGCKVLMYGCGIGPVSRERNRRLAANVLNRCVDTISLRDRLSLIELDRLGVSAPEIILSADPAMSLQKAQKSEIDRVFRAEHLPENTPLLCLCLRNWRQANRARAFAEAAEYAYRKYGFHAVFLPTEHPRDLPANRQAASLMATPCHVIENAYPPHILTGLLARMDAVLSMRLHALIFAAGQGVPVAGVSYDIKVDGFMHYIESPLVLSLADASAESLCVLVDGLAQSDGTASETAARLMEKEHLNRAAAANLLGLPPHAANPSKGTEP